MGVKLHTLLAVGVALGTLGLIVWPLELSLAHAETVRLRLQLLPGDVGWLLDAFKNTAAFVPLGAALRPLPSLAVVAAGAVLSTGAEVIQVFQPHRFVSFTDVVFNAFGALLGHGLAVQAPVVLNRLRTSRVGPRLAATVAGIGLTLTAVWAIDRGMRATRWNPEYVLARNSSALGQVPWCGTLHSLEVEAGDDRRTLDGIPWTREVMDGGPCRGEPWWTTPPLPSLARAVQAEGAISIQLAATPTRNQIGPARILTWADTGDGRRRNVLIAQESDSLVVYVRRGLGGEEGRRPYYVIPGVFQAEATSRVALDITQERTIIRTDAGTVVHRYDPAQDWLHLLRGRSRYAPGGSVRQVAFWSATSAPAMVVAGAAVGAAGLPGALMVLVGAALVLLGGGVLITGGAPAPAGAAWLMVLCLGLAVRRYVRTSADGGSLPRESVRAGGGNS